jgi:putative sigma-54 modulation protein
MKITYTGRQAEFPPEQLKKIEGQFSKLSKLLDNGGECTAHVVISHERHLHHAEVTINYHHHALVGLCSDADAFTAFHGAILKLEKQAVKVREKWRDGHRLGDTKEIIASKAPVDTQPADDIKPAGV